MKLDEAMEWMDEAKGEHVNEGLGLGLDLGLDLGESSVQNENFTQWIGFTKGLCKILS